MSFIIRHLIVPVRKVHIKHSKPAGKYATNKKPLFFTS